MKKRQYLYSCLLFINTINMRTDILLLSASVFYPIRRHVFLVAILGILMTIDILQENSAHITKKCLSLSLI